MIDPVVLGIKSVGPHEVALGLGLAPDHPAFAGHFPDRPILPGVVQIDWAVRLADKYLKIGQSVATDFQVKFRRVITPGTVELRLWLVPDKRSLSFEYRSVGEIASIGRIKLDGL